MWGWRGDRIAILGVATVVAVACCVLPLGYLLIGSSRELLGNVGFLVLDERQRNLLYTTALLGVGTALGASAIGVPLGLVLARTALPFKRLQRLALAAPVLLPSHVVALAWIYFGSTRGIAATLLGRDFLSNWTYGLPAAVLVSSFIYYPVAMLATETAMRRIDGRLEEAGLLVATPRRVLQRVSLPLAAPLVVAAALVIFVLAASDFAVPGLLRVRVYTTEVFTAFSALFDFSRAIVLAVPLVLLSIAVAVPAGILAGRQSSTPRRTSGAPPILLNHWRRRAQVWAMTIMTTALLLPLTVLTHEASLARDPAAVISGSRTAIVNSLLFAGAGATLVVAVAVWLGYAVARAHWRFEGAIVIACVALFAVPSTVVGVALIALWNQPGAPGLVYGTNAMLLLGYLARFIPIALLVTHAAARQVTRSHEEAAAMSGASWLRTMRRIVLPQMLSGLIVAWVVVFILAFGELGVSILIAPPGETTLPIRIYTMIANTPPSHVALLALLQALTVFVPLALLALAAPGRVRG